MSSKSTKKLYKVLDKQMKRYNVREFRIPFEDKVISDFLGRFLDRQSFDINTNISEATILGVSKQ